MFRKRHEREHGRQRGERDRHGGEQGHEEREHRMHRRGMRGGFPDWGMGEERFAGGRRGGPFGPGPFGPRGGPFGGRGGPDGPGERGRRQRRGDIKIALLGLLAEQSRHGYDLIKELEQRSAGFYRPSPGSVYPTLQLLEDEGNVTSEMVEGKRVYTITDAGRALFEQQQDERPRHGRERRGRWAEENKDLAALQQSVMALGSGVMQVARHGTTEQVAEVTGKLEALRREIYAILAREEYSTDDTPSEPS